MRSGEVQGRIGVAILGCGRIAERRHAPEYAANPHCRIIGFYDPRRERAEELAARYGAAVYGSAEALINDPAVAAVSVCTINDLHAEMSVAALGAGRHVLCEKPIASTLSDAERILEAERSSPALFMAAHNQRMMEAHTEAKRLLDSGALGWVLSFSSAFCHRGPEAWINRPDDIWLYENRDEASGVLADLGIHKIDLLRWLVGDEIAEVRAFSATLDKKTASGKPIDAADNAALAVRFRGGTIGTLLVSWTAYGDEDNSTVLHCSGGVLRLYRDGEYQLAVDYKDGRRERANLRQIATNEKQTKSGVIDLFIDSIRNRVPSPITAEDGAMALTHIINAVRQR